jgi:ATP-dependent exoDNAse (exonuclease V) alpha subunit
LTNKDQITIVAGKAGTGKTTLMKDAVNFICKAGYHVQVVAPTAQAARGVLKQEGFSEAETVAKFLTDRKLQAKLKDGVLWVDEAGLLGVSDMLALLKIVKQTRSRLILGGDITQHASVARGDALRILEKLGGVSVSVVDKIYRQKNDNYKIAVDAISKGDMKLGFEKLDDLGFIREMNNSEDSGHLVNEYIDSLKSRKSALVICPTHKQGDNITKEIRKALKKHKIISKKEKIFSRLVNLNMTEAEKADGRSYFPGHVLQFSQNMKGINRGSKWMVEKLAENNVIQLTNNKNEQRFFDVTGKPDFDVFQKNEIALSKADTIRITRNSFDTKQNRLINGQELKVVGFTRNNLIKVKNLHSKKEYVMSGEWAHFQHSYCITSHASQGKTVDDVFIYQPSETFPATDLKQFYVSVSRGRDKAVVYTDEKENLFEHASKLRNRQSALELFQLSNKSLTSKDGGQIPKGQNFGVGNPRQHQRSNPLL